MLIRTLHGCGGADEAPGSHVRIYRQQGMHRWQEVFEELRADLPRSSGRQTKSNKTCARMKIQPERTRTTRAITSFKANEVPSAAAKEP
jgi:hypothetical protein